MLAEDASTYVTFARLRPDSLGAEATFRPLGADGAPIPGAEYWYGDVQRDGKGGTAVVDYERERAKPEGSNYFVEKTSTLVINAGQSPILIRRRRRDGEKEATEVGRGPATKADVARASAQLAAATAEKNPTPPPAAAVQPTR